MSDTLAQKTQEELIELVQRLRDSNAALRQGDSAAIAALEKRCASYRKAKRLANARADQAVAAMRAMLAAFEDAAP